MAGGVPPPPGLGAMPAMIAVPAKPVVKMPYEKRELTVKSKMKVFHWNRIQNEKILGTCWAKLTDQNVSIDEAGFAQLFGKRKRKKAGVAVDKDKSKMGAAAGGPKRRKKREVVTLVDSKRSYNIGIALARFKMPPEAIRDALLQMDGAVLNEDRITTLLKCKPTSDEIALVKSYDGDTEALGPTEKFFLKLSEIPEVNFRIESFLFRVRFDRVVSEVQDMIDAMNLATGTLKESQRFFSVLEFVLALGNYMNNGRPNGAAYGVKLNSLNKLRGVKTTDGKSNLLEYVVQMFEGSDAKRDKLQFVDEFDAVKDAQRIDISYMKTSVAKTVGMVNRIGRAVEKSPDSTADRYKPVMSEFHSYASERVGQLNDACNTALDKVNDLVRYFGEDAKRTSTAEFFAFFTSFADSVRKTRAILAKKKEVEERQRRREAAEHEKKEAKQKRREEKKKRVKKPRKIKKNIVGAVVGTLRVADADKIRAAFRKRQKMGTLRFSNAAGVPRKRSSNARKRVSKLTRHGSRAPPPLPLFLSHLLVFCADFCVEKTKKRRKREANTVRHSMRHSTNVGSHAHTMPDTVRARASRREQQDDGPVRSQFIGQDQSQWARQQRLRSWHDDGYTLFGRNSLQHEARSTKQHKQIHVPYRIICLPTNSVF